MSSSGTAPFLRMSRGQLGSAQLPPEGYTITIDADGTVMIEGDFAGCSRTRPRQARAHDGTLPVGVVRLA
jgi:hypothetical protein